MATDSMGVVALWDSNIESSAFVHSRIWDWKSSLAIFINPASISLVDLPLLVVVCSMIA